MHWLLSWRVRTCELRDVSDVLLLDKANYYHSAKYLKSYILIAEALERRSVPRV